MAMPSMRVRVYICRDITYGRLGLDRDQNKIFVDFESVRYERMYLGDKRIHGIDVMYPTPV